MCQICSTTTGKRRKSVGTIPGTNIQACRACLEFYEHEFKEK